VTWFISIVKQAPSKTIPCIVKHVKTLYNCKSNFKTNFNDALKIMLYGMTNSSKYEISAGNVVVS
jgi:hypothetical protein